MADKPVNYTEDQTKFLFDEYTAKGTAGMAEIVAAYNAKFSEDRSVNSVRGKIMTLKNPETGELIYQVQPKVEKPKVDKGPTKDDMLAELAKLVPFNTDNLKGATKAGIQDVIALAKSVAKTA